MMLTTSVALLAAFLVTFTRLIAPLSPLKAEYLVPPSPLPVLEPNQLLERAGERILSGEVLGPESIVFKGNDLYTGLMDGRIVKINTKSLKIEEFFRFNASCGAFKGTYDEYPPELEPLCGRPLGIRIDPNDGSFLVAESYSGLYRISADGTRSELLVGEVDGRKITFINDLDIAEDGTIYFTETSDRWGRNKVILEIFATRRVGTLVSFHPRDIQGTMRVFKGFLPCNGVSVSHDQKSVYFISSPRIYRLDRASSHVEIAFDNAPAVMDNIRRRRNMPGRYLVGCASKRSKPFSLPDLLAPYPLIRNLLAFVMPQSMFLRLIPRMGLLIDVELKPGSEGRLVSSFQDRSTNGIAYVSEAEEHSDGYVYSGTWHESHLVRAKASELFSS